MPDWRAEIASRLAPLGLSPVREESVITELAQHLDQHYAELLANGLPEESARQIAISGLDEHDVLAELRKIPANESARPSSATLGGWASEVRFDARFGLRMLRKNPGFAAVAILTLAVGIGANTAIFSVVNAVLLEPLPFRDAGKLVLIRERIPKLSSVPIHVPAPDVLEFAAENRSFEAVAAYRPMLFELSGGARPQIARVIRASANLMPLLGAVPAIGRIFSTQEEDANQKLAILNYAVWQDQFGRDPSVIGRTLYLDRVPYTVVGVMPRGIEFPLPVSGAASRRTDIWIPLSLTANERRAWADNYDYNAIARLRSGVALQQANEDVQRIQQQIRAHYPASERDLEMSALVIPLREEVVGGVRRLLLLLLSAVGCVLLIACANVANLLMTRAVGRSREIAVKRALGATGGRIAAQVFVESSLLAAFGAVAGVIVAVAGTRFLLDVIPAGIPLVHPVTVNRVVLVFAAGVAMLTAVLFGMMPALSATHIPVNEALKQGTSVSGKFQQRKLRAVVVLEVGLAMMLLSSAGLLLRSFAYVRQTPSGVSPQGVLTATMRLPLDRYHAGPEVFNFCSMLIEGLEHLPGAIVASVSTDLPLETGWTRLFSVEGHAVSTTELNLASHTNVLGDYFTTMGIPLLRGRAFTPADSVNDAPVIIVSESLARRYWPNQDPIGKRVKWGSAQSTSPWLTVVGIVGEVKQGPLDQATRPHTYSPYSEIDDGRPSSVELRTSGDPEEFAADLRRVVAQLDPQLAVSEVRTMTEVIDESTAPRKATLLLLLVFAGSALLLAAIGIYGVVAYSVAQRTRELGIRLALGADRWQVLLMIFGSGIELILTGAILGTLGALATSRVMRQMLFEVKPADPLSLAGGAAVLIAIAALATYLPARRATKVDPMVTLRYE